MPRAGFWRELENAFRRSAFTMFPYASAYLGSGALQLAERWSFDSSAATPIVPISSWIVYRRGLKGFSPRAVIAAGTTSAQRECHRAGRGNGVGTPLIRAAERVCGEILNADGAANR